LRISVFGLGLPVVRFAGSRSSVRASVARNGRTTTELGYGNVHQRMRERLVPLARAGRLRCVFCGEPIVGEFHLDHTDDRRGWTGAARDVGFGGSSYGRTDVNLPFRT
jgi:hypothetical protein